MKPWLHLCAGLWLAAIPAGPAPAAAASLYTTEPSFVAAIGASQSYLNDLNDLTVQERFAHPLGYSANGFAYSIITNPQFHLVSLIGALTTADTNAEIDVSFTSGNVRAVGGWFYLTDSNGAPVSGSVTITLSDGTTAGVGVSSNAPPFTGFVSSGPLITLLAVRSEAAGGYPTLDHFYVAEGIPALSVAPAETNRLVLSWPAPATGYVLESSPRLPAVAWTNVAPAPEQLGDRMRVVVPAPDAAGFYRLHKH